MKALRNPRIVFVFCLSILFGGVLLQSFSSPDLAKAAKGGQPNIDICHYDADTDTHHLITVGAPAVPAHVAHGDPAIGGACSAGVGECEVSGTLVCSESGAVCDAVPGDPSPEVCDGLDNDCDASSDEDLGQTTCGLGICQVTVYNCVAGVPLVCTPGVAGTEVCNGLDDDCDGLVDEDIPSVPTTCGVGTCGATGATSCVNGAVVDSCVPGVPAANDASCNARDDDCDGSKDEDFVSTPTACGTGACAAVGATSCVNGAIANSCTPSPSSPEICNSIDDNCNGVVDDACVAP